MASKFNKEGKYLLENDNIPFKTLLMDTVLRSQFRLKAWLAVSYIFSTLASDSSFLFDFLNHRTSVFLRMSATVLCSRLNCDVMVSAAL